MDRQTSLRGFSDLDDLIAGVRVDGRWSMYSVAGRSVSPRRPTHVASSRPRASNQLIIMRSTTDRDGNTMAIMSGGRTALPFVNI